MRTLKLVSLASFVFLVGCQSRADLEEGRHYSCDPSAGGIDQQCPGDWVCLLDGYCQDPSVGVSARCNAPSDCTGGWHCGAEGQCYDRTTVGSVACRQEVPQDCRDGWHCGVEGECYDRATVGAVQCRQEVPNDCRDGWHCGVDNVCYDRATAGDVECRQDVPEDCAPGWRCGLERTCHDTTVGAAYRCDDGSDSWCEQGWRCGPERRCVDARAEALRPAPTVQVARLSPTYPVRADEIAGTGSHQDGELIAVRAGTQLWVGMSDGYDYAATSLQLPGVASVATVGARVYWVDGAGLWAATSDYVTLGEPEPIDLSGLAAPLILRTLNDQQDLLAVIAGDRVGFVTPSGAAVTDLQQPLAGQPIHDVVDVTYRPLSRPSDDEWNAALIAATGGGLYIAYQSVEDGSPPPLNFRPVSVPGIRNPECGDAAGARPVKLSAGSYNYYAPDWWVAVQLEGAPGAPPQLTLLYRAEKAHPTADCPTDEFEVVIPPVDPCPGEALVDFKVAVSDQELYVRCRSSGPNPVESTWTWWRNAQNEPERFRNDPVLTAEPFDLPALTSATNPGVLTLLEQSGRLGSCDPGDGYPYCYWFGPESAPMLAVPMPDGGVAPFTHYYDRNQDRHIASSLGWGAFGLEGQYSYFGEPVNGGASPTPNPCGAIRGAPGTVVFCEPEQEVRIYDLAVIRDAPVSDVVNPIGTLWSSRDAFALADPFPRVHGDVTSLPDGGTLTLVAAGEAIYATSGPLEYVNAPAGLTARAVPQVRAQITALAAAQRASSPWLVDSYVIAGQRVFRVSARTELQWFSAPVDLPPGTPIAVWMDGASGRVGFEDGRVFGLPTGVQIGEALPAAAARVLEYAEVCGTAYAVTESAVLQLTTDPAGGPIGVWRAIDLAEAGLPAQGMRFQPPQLDQDEYYYEVYRPEPVEHLAESGNRLVVFTAGGAAIELADTSCSQ